MTTHEFWDDKDFNRSLAGQAAGRLMIIHKAISEWVGQAMKELDAKMAAEKASMKPNQSDLFEAYQEAQETILDGVINALNAGIAVSISSTVESFMGAMCKEYNPTLKSNAGWSDKRLAIESRLEDKDFDGLPGYQMVTRARLLSNCYKHTDGKTNAGWDKAFGGEEGEEINYAAETWNDLIEGIRIFLLAMVETMP